MYPSNLLELVKRDKATPESDELQEPHQLDDKQARKERLQHAAQEGRHISNQVRQGRGEMIPAGGTTIIRSGSVAWFVIRD